MLQFRMKEEIKILNLPRDDFYYLVIKYGAAVMLNTSSKIPNIQVILRKVNFDNKSFIQNSNDLIVYIPLPELDELRIGSVWKKQQKVLNNWQNYNNFQYMEKLPFNFNFLLKSPETITFNERIDNLGTTLKDIYKLNIQKSELNQMAYLNKTIYTKLIDDRGVTVLIPSIELFVSSYTPEHKIIKQRLLQFNIDEAISEFINDKYTKIVEEEYQIGLHKKMEDSNIKFLAYAKFNKISRKRISYLSSSLEFEEGDIICKCKVRYPKVLPYHPIHLFISCDGLWLNQNIFLVQRISTISIPSDIKVKAIIENKVYKIEKEIDNLEKEINERTFKDNEKGIEENKDLQLTNIPLLIDSNSEPRTRTSALKIKTQVNIVDENKPIIGIFNIEVEQKKYLEDIRGENDKYKNNEDGENKIEKKHNNEDIILSDAEKNFSGKDSMQIESLPSFSDNETYTLINEISKILNIFKIEGFIIDYKYLDINFQESVEFTKTTFYGTLMHNGFNKNDLGNSWYKLRQRVNNKLDDLGYREYFLIKIKLNINEYCYLLEIGKKSSENYLGVIFKNENFNSLSIIDLSNFLKDIVNNEGNYSKKDPEIKDEKKLKPVELDVKYKTYSHKFNEKLKQFINLQNNIKNKIKLLKVLK